jgi:phosphohistidine phosphatase
MKELVILRHAKSNRTYRVDDIHRPLLEQGIARIEKVAHQKGSFFQDADIILSSPANRALHTAIIKVVLVGHNPAFTEVINHFSSPGINHLRTAGLAKITFEEELWHELSRGELELGQKIKQ